ncbi:MAG: site-specific integrase [Candidatus Pacearchaeota archaeon]|jgi:integrase
MTDELPKENVLLWSAPKNVKHTTKVFTRKEITLMFKTLRNCKDYFKNPLGEFQRMRDYTCLQFLYWCALRPAEACRLRFKDVDLKKNLLFVSGTSNKTHKDRIIPLPQQVIPHFKNYLKMPDKYWRDSDYLFPSLSNNFMATKTLEVTFREKVLKVCGLYEPANLKHKCPKDCRTRLYSLRKSRASQLLEQSKDLYLVANFLGHADIRVTASYYIHANTEYLSYMKKIINGDIKATRRPDIQINQTNITNVLMKQQTFIIQSLEQQQKRTDMIISILEKGISKEQINKLKKEA